MLEKGSVRIFTFLGIPVRIHWSFGLLLVWIWYIGQRTGMVWPALGVLALLVFSLFICVVLHEFGHAIMARRYGVITKDIILSPIGGMARLNRIPEKPLQELAVALAGPMVNVVIAILLGLVLWFFLPDKLTVIRDPEISIYWIGNIIPALFWMNIMLVFFNLIPAFPMDGGRVLRAGLAMQFGRLKATKWAAHIGKAIAVLFVVLAFYWGHFFLGLIGVFVFIMGEQEYRAVKTDLLLKHIKLSDVIRTDYQVIPPDMRLIDALSVIRHSLAVNIPIGEPARGLIGYLNARDLISMLKSDEESENLEVLQVMKSFPGEFMEHTSIEAIMPIFHKNRNACVLVKDIWGNIIGIIDADQIDHALYWHNHLRKPTV